MDGVEVRVSSDLSYTIPADTDLTQQQTYIARFEYRLITIPLQLGKKIDDYTEPDLHAQRWQRYNSAFVDLPALPTTRGHSSIGRRTIPMPRLQGMPILGM